MISSIALEAFSIMFSWLAELLGQNDCVCPRIDTSEKKLLGVFCMRVAKVSIFSGALTLDNSFVCVIISFTL